jgi:GntR family transcriptional regulator
MLDSLRELIRSGEFAEGDRFLTERQVSEQFHVSRPTANKALASLVAEGALEFRKGVGTFVRGKVLDYDLASLVSFTRKALSAGKKPATQVLAFEPVSAVDLPPDMSAWIAADPATELFYMERLRLADGVPVIYEHRWVVAAHCPGLERRHLHGSLYQAWTEDFHLHLGRSEQRIRAVNLQGAEARLLGVPVGQAAFELLCKGLLLSGEPLWVERTLYRGDTYEFQQNRGAAGQSAPGRMADRHG